MKNEMLFYPQEVQTGNSEKDYIPEFSLEEKRSIIENIPENGLIIHGCSNKWAQGKIEKGFPKVSGDERVMFVNYIPKPKDNYLQTEEGINQVFEEIKMRVRDSAKYALGFFSTTYDITRQNLVNTGEFTYKQVFKQMDDRYPVMLIFSGTPEIQQKYESLYVNKNNEMVHFVGGEKRTDNVEIPASNFMMQIGLADAELPNSDNTEFENLLKGVVTHKVLSALALPTQQGVKY